LRCESSPVTPPPPSSTTPGASPLTPSALTSIPLCSFCPPVGWCKRTVVRFRRQGGGRGEVGHSRHHGNTQVFNMYPLCIRLRTFTKLYRLAGSYGNENNRHNQKPYKH
jgi:hypothetical protein